VRPFDRVFAEILKHEDFTQAMQPRLAVPQGQQRQQNLAAAVAQTFGDTGAAAVEKSEGQKRRARKAQNKRDAKQVQQNPKPKIQSPPANQGGKAKGKGKPFDGPRLPAGLYGMCPRSNQATNAKRLCFAFNLGQCAAASPGGDCVKGAHLCMKPLPNGEACSAPHGAHACTAS
jgi:hypothetical protein